MIRLGTFAILLIAVLACVSFVIGNHNDITLRFPPSDVAVTLPLYLMAACIAVLSVLFALLSASIHYGRKIFRLKRRLKQAMKEKDGLEKALKHERTERYAREQMQKQLLTLEHSA